MRKIGIFAKKSRDHNATSYSTETFVSAVELTNSYAEIITLRAIALKHCIQGEGRALEQGRDHNATSYSTETKVIWPPSVSFQSRDHNATSYSTETNNPTRSDSEHSCAEIITLRAIALKLVSLNLSLSTDTAEIITLRAIALKPHLPNDVVRVFGAEIITLRAIALKHFTGNRGMGVLYAEIITLRAIALKH